MPVTSRTHGMCLSTIGAVVLRDDWTCAYCPRRLAWSAIVFDHVVPRSAGGSNRADNIVVACASCNIIKGSGSVPVHAEAEVKRRLAAPLDREAGQALAEQHYGPWAAQRRANMAAKDQRRRARLRDLGRGLAGTSFPFGALAEAS